MPELPDIVVYIEALERRIAGQRLQRIRLLNPFLLRTADPPISAAEGKQVIGLRRIGKRIVIELEDDLYVVLHLMIAGRLRWDTSGKAPARSAQAVLQFSCGSLIFTEAGTKRRASLHLVRGKQALRPFDAGGIEVLEADLAAFSMRLKAENHTLKRALTDPHLFSGIGNAYSDEILHRARLSPIALTSRLSAQEVARLRLAAQSVLTEWTDRLRQQAGDGFPEKVTAFHEHMAVHGRHGQPCPVCGACVQRIVFADTETNYCARCQTSGRILADRARSRLLKKSWPRDIDELG